MRDRTGRSLIDNVQKGVPSFEKQRERANNPPRPRGTSSFLVLLPSLPPPPPFRLFRTSIPRALPFLFSSTRPFSPFRLAAARILNRAHYLRAIIIPKTNSYFLLRNRKLINQSSRSPGPRRGPILAPLKKLRVGPGAPVWTRV